MIITHRPCHIGNMGNGGPLGVNSVIDCGYSAAAIEIATIPLQYLVKFILYFNYSNKWKHNISQTGGTGSTDCSIVTCLADAGTYSLLLMANVTVVHLLLYVQMIVLILYQIMITFYRLLIVGHLINVCYFIGATTTLQPRNIEFSGMFWMIKTLIL